MNRINIYTFNNYTYIIYNIFSLKHPYIWLINKSLITVLYFLQIKYDLKYI